MQTPIHLVRLAQKGRILGLFAVLVLTGCVQGGDDGAAQTTIPTAADAVADAAGDVETSTDASAPHPDVSAKDVAANRGPRPIPPPTVFEPTGKVIAIGDLHGDIARTRTALKLAGLIDDKDTWIGGDTVLVQVGDQLDRGDGEKAILLLLDSLAEQAHKAGGGVLAINGNHETMNVRLQFNYVTPGGFKDFADTPFNPNDPLIQQFIPSQRGRAAAFRPNGPYANLLAGHNTVQIVGDSIFVHGGLLPEHVIYGVEHINKDISTWMKAKGDRPKTLTSGEASPVWSRHYSLDTDAADCKLADQVLSALGRKRIVVAHTVQSKGINSVCGGKVWRIDVGLAKHYGGKAQALVIDGDKVSVIK